jgi:hypothetical protein
MKRALFSVALAMAGTAQAARWNAANNPNMVTRITKTPLVTNIRSLPMAAAITNTHYIWSDTFWPNNKGGIAYRWNNEPNPENFTYRRLSKNELRNMSTVQLEKLSPAEKYDIYMGRYDYPLTRRVLAQNNPRDLWWTGICHGWAMAAISHPEPARVDLVNADGITVPFGSSDVKGLLDFYYAKVHKTTERFQIGRRCKVQGKVPGEGSERDRVRTMPNERAANSEDCADMNAGAFHLAITNMVGLNDKGLVVEIDRFNDVWNQPMGEYASRIVSSRPAKSAEARYGTAQVLRVRTDMTYGEELNLLEPSQRNDEGGFMSMDPVTGTPANTKLMKEYEYDLELDARGNIIGGTWITATRPDFIWTKAPATTFLDSDYGLGGLNRIYRPVTD